jgi:hypothetical protein
VITTLPGSAGSLHPALEPDAVFGQVADGERAECFRLREHGMLLSSSLVCAGLVE